MRSLSFFSIQSKAKYKCVVWFVSNANLILFVTITFILKFQKRSIKENSILFCFLNTDCGGFVHLKENDPSLERDRDVTVTSPNYPGSVGQGKICRWAITVKFVKNKFEKLYLQGLL